MNMGKALVRGGLMAAALLSAGVVAAEVRLQYAGGTTYDVVVVPTWRGPWTPTGNVTPLVLNPTGDLSGDSMPGWDGSESVLTAWLRPITETVEKAVGSAQGWQQLAPWPADGGIGQPIVDEVDGGWGVTWQSQDSTGLHVWCAGIGSEGGEAIPQVVADGRLVGTWVIEGELWIVTTEGTGQSLQLTHVSLAFVPTQPLPISAIYRPGPIGMIGMTPLLTADIRLHGAVGASGQPLLVVTWWKAPRTLSWVVVGEHDVVQSERNLSSTSTAVRPEKLLEAALRDASKIR